MVSKPGWLQECWGPRPGIPRGWMSASVPHQKLIVPFSHTTDARYGPNDLSWGPLGKWLRDVTTPPLSRLYWLFAAELGPIRLFLQAGPGVSSRRTAPVAVLRCNVI